MARYIHLADDRGRDAEIIFSGKAKKASCKQVTQTGEDVKKIRVLKGTAGTSFDAISRANNGDANAISKAIMDHDPDIDLYVCGQVISGTTRVYIGQDLKPVSSISRKERVYAPDGALIEERIPKEVLANIMLENPIRPGKLFPKKDIYNKLVFAKKYQIFHINGLTFDFLYEIARKLHENDSLCMVGGGLKGNEPLVFQDGGKSYRAFLEGRVKDQGYILLLHLSNLELKSMPNL